MAHPLKRVLVTGFGGFPGAAVNPTTTLVRALPGLARLRRIELITAILPTRWADGPALVSALIAEHRPDAVVMFGVAGGRRGFSLEMHARNKAQRLRPDAAGAVAPQRFLAAGAPFRLNGRAPFRQVLAAMRNVTPAVALSRDAGDYLCNAAYWRALTSFAGPAAFIHVPGRRLRLAPAARRMLTARVAAVAILTMAAARKRPCDTP